MAELSDTGESVPFGENVHISSHPVIAHKITILRSSATPHGTFRAVTKELTYHLGYEATSSLSTKPISISVPMPSKDKVEKHMDWQGDKIKEHVSLIPILRSGLGMVEAMMELLPNAAVHHIGMYKVIGSNPVQYYNRLPRECTSDVAYILDLVIGTSSTIMSVLNILKKWGVPEIHVVAVLASKSGVEKLVEAHPDVRFTIGTIDERISEYGVVIPGLGDSGDRLFGTVVPSIDEDESLMHPSRRKRPLSS